MSDRVSSFFSSQAIFGFILLVIGAAFLLDNMEVLRAREILRYWPVVLIVFGTIKASESGPAGSRFFGVGLAVVGLLLLLNSLYIIDFHIWDLWPLILVLMGISMIWRVVAGTGVDSGSGDSFVRSTVFMGGGKRVNLSKEFRGGELSAVMGGIQLDLRGAQMQGPEAVINLFTFWGGVEIHIPPEWHVDVRVTPLLGGVDDKTKHPKDAMAKRLVVKGTVVMGGAEIKN